MEHGSTYSRVLPGTPHPLGATWDGHGTNFAVYSAEAAQIDVCLYEGDNPAPFRVVPLPERSYRIWHGYLPDVGPGTRYGLKVHGPWEPENGLRFNPTKLLMDPYARAIAGSVVWGPPCFDYAMDGDIDNLENLEPSDLPNETNVPRSVVVDNRFDWEGDTRPHTNWYDTVFYEVHVKGFSMTNPNVPEAIRGTYAGLAHEASIAHLKELGITAVELLPVHAFVDDQFLVEKDLKNYWGYSTLGFFAPEPRYAADTSPDGPMREFKQMVKDLHRAGLEVILDVVFNHTCEGNHLGPTLSFRGIDNRSYYKLDPANDGIYLNYSGTGNTVNVTHPQVTTMVLDSLRYWVEEMHVDGFRFDLAVTLGRDYPDFNRNTGFFKAMHQDPVLSTVKLIAEPWDVGPGGYQVGNFPILWSEWNDKFRDDVRTFWQTSQPVMPAMGYRLTASSDLYQLSGRKPKACVNMITTHDGYTLTDLVTYKDKYNEDNLENNHDGHNYNITNNYGVEGPTDDPAILDLRHRQRRNMMATLLFSQGIPLICGGDEMGRTQEGNNNAYCQDNELSWFNWALSEADQQMFAFTRRAIGIRADYAALRRRVYFRGMPQAEGTLKDVMWLHPEGWEYGVGDWSNPALQTIGVRLDGAAINELDTEGIPLEPTSIMMIIHAGTEPISFVLPQVDRSEDLVNWTALLSTDSPTGETDVVARAGSRIEVPGRTVMLFVPSTEVVDDPRFEG